MEAGSAVMSCSGARRGQLLCVFFFPHPLLVPRILSVYPTIFHFARVRLQHPLA